MARNFGKKLNACWSTCELVLFDFLSKELIKKIKSSSKLIYSGSCMKLRRGIEHRSMIGIILSTKCSCSATYLITLQHLAMRNSIFLVPFFFTVVFAFPPRRSSVFFGLRASIDASCSRMARATIASSSLLRLFSVKDP